ncbi:DM13 domain-containing protein [Kribbella sp. VKM Ac-2568]|uniref:DM13 domain-containing protein n=1 Tax=Kribbella sp. VKM Ac-2568 TaxID=2512219 RepID=UPI001047B591|nr:DM13 domain-containing protein [Kribbella sp. VKM Ac-2568]TCM50391.1 electron transfer DM13 [Kribbella sp. VKM Ac-2568]
MPTPSRRAVAVTVVAVAAVVAAVALPLFQPWRLFTDTVVDEALPGADPISMTTSSAAPPTISGDRSGTPSSGATQAPGKSQSRGPERLSTGRFITHEHDTQGTASIVRLADGSRVLRLEGLDTSDGPDLEVWLSDAPVLEGKAGWHVFDDGRYRSLGQLKGNRGNQNYPIPASVELADFTSVSIWCNRFNVSFGAAKLLQV